MFASLTRVDPDNTDVPIAPTERDTVFQNGTARVYRFRNPGETREDTRPLLLVPSMINRWYVLDLRPGASLVESLVERGFEVFAVDWGIANPEDRHLSWDDIVERLGRCVRAVKRHTGDEKLGLLGYCMGGTLTAIHTALHPDDVEAYVHLTAPVDFSDSGILGKLVDKKWFDASAITEAGNIAPHQMQSGFVALRPTGQISKWVTLADRADNEDYVEAFRSLETWVNDNVPFPGDAYETYIRELYQENRLVRGEHYIRGRPVELGEIDCPILTVTAEYDNICPPESARALNERAGSGDTEYVVVSSGHVGAVVGSKGPNRLYPKIGDWFAEKAQRPS